MIFHPLVYIIILNWNGWQDTIACVQSCAALTWTNFRIVLIDNASTDGSEAILRKRLPDIEIIQSGANLGFAGGNNVGIRHALQAGADYIWLLNNDAEVAPEALTALVERMEGNPRAGIVGSKIYLHNDPERLDFAGGLWEKGRLRSELLGARQLDRGQFDALSERGSASGCSMLVRSQMIKNVGMMDESYFLYWEDTEWCARCQRKGYTVLFAPQSHVWHKVSASTGKDSFAQHYYFFRNGFFFLRQYDPFLLPVFAAINSLFCCKCFAIGKLKPLLGFIRGFADFIRGQKGPIRNSGREKTGVNLPAAESQTQ